MGIFDTLRKGFRMLFSPSVESKGNYSIKKSLKFFYTLALFGFIFALVFSLILYFAGIGTSSITMFSSLVGQNSSIYLAILLIAATMFVLGPVGIFINAALYQLVGKPFLKIWNGSYEKTFAAVTAACAPILLFYWLTELPIIGFGVTLVLAVWEIVLLTITMSVQQKVTRLKALSVFLLTLVIVCAIAIVIALIVLTGLVYTGMGYPGPVI